MKNNKNVSVLPILCLIIYVQSICIICAQESFSPDHFWVSKPQYSQIEPNIDLAKLWWPDQRNVWTPIGWKSHYFRFNVLYNGAIIADPNGSWLASRSSAIPFVGRDFLLVIKPTPDGNPHPLPKERTPISKIDGGHGQQGWVVGDETPVLYTDFPLQEGLIIRQEVFAHTKSGKQQNSNDIPSIYAWIRLSVIYVDESCHVDNYPVSVQMSKNYYDHYDHFEYAVSVDINPLAAPYPKELRHVKFLSNKNEGIRVLEPDDKVRLIALPTAEGKISFSQVGQGIYSLKINMNAQVGDRVDILLPMLPAELSEIEEEMKLGYEAALTGSNIFWSEKPNSASTINVPEDYINNVVSQSLKFAEVIAQKDYLTKEYSFLSGSWGYDNLWATPTSMVSHMFLDILGYHEIVHKHIELFRKNQGTVKPPGPAYSLHPGYYSTPKSLTAIDWLTDHGAILHQVSTHALLTNDSIFIRDWTKSIVKACEFIKDMSSVTNHNGIHGLLPPAVATDEELPLQAIWNLAWNYKGLSTAVRLLKKINHPRAAEFELFASNFKNIFVENYRLLAENGEHWTDSTGRRRYKPPTIMSNEPQQHHIFTDAFYLDTGPMVLVWAGLMAANDPIMKDVVDFFRYGNNRLLFGTVGHALSRPFLTYEMSSCEPCYSWNVFHSWQLGERKFFLEGMYSLFVGALSQNTYISCEHRHGIQGSLFATPLATYLARLAVIDDQIAREKNELHLLRLCPLAWVSSKKATVFQNMPTEYGIVNLRFEKSADGNTLKVQFDGNWYGTPPQIILHPVPDKEIDEIVLNGKRYSQGMKIIF